MNATQQRLFFSSVGLSLGLSLACTSAVSAQTDGTCIPVRMTPHETRYSVTTSACVAPRTALMAIDLSSVTKRPPCETASASKYTSVS